MLMLIEDPNPVQDKLLGKPKTHLDVSIYKWPNKKPVIIIKPVSCEDGCTSYGTDYHNDRRIADVSDNRRCSYKKQQAILAEEMVDKGSRTWEAIRDICKENNYKLLGHFE